MTEAVVYELQLRGNLKSEATATATAVKQLGTAATETAEAVGGKGTGKKTVAQASDTAKVAIQGFKEQVGGAKADLLLLAGPAGIAAAAIGLTAAAVVKLANASIEARDRLRELNVPLGDTAGIDRYEQSTTRLTVAFDRLLVAVGDELGDGLGGVVDAAAGGVEKVTRFAGAVDLLQTALAGLISPNSRAAIALLGGLLASPGDLGDYGPSADLAPTSAPYRATPDYGPGAELAPLFSAYDRDRATAASLAARSDYVGDPLGYRMGPGMVTSEGYGADYAGVMGQGLSHGLNSLGLAMAANTTATQANTEAALLGGGSGLDAAGAALGGGSLGTVVGLAAGGPVGALIGTVVDQVLGGSLADTVQALLQAQMDLPRMLPEAIGQVLGEVLPEAIRAMPEVLSYLLVGLSSDLTQAVIGSLDELGAALLEALLSLPAAFAAELADAINPFKGSIGSGGGDTRAGEWSRGQTLAGMGQTQRGGQRTEIHLHGQSSKELFQRMRRDQGSYGLNYSTDPL